MNEFVIFLTSPKATRELVGTKGINLVELVRAGFPVPPAFMITTSAYKTFIEDNKLTERIEALEKSASKDGAKGWESAEASIKEIFEQAVIREELAELVESAFAQLTESVENGVAVRSSGIAEDLPSASFAGQQDTYLNIRGKVALLEAVKRCWASMWTARAMSYRHQLGFRSAELSMAIIVQQMIEPDAAGVLYTVNPTSGNNQEAWINSTWGLGETIVAGDVTPDVYVVDKASAEIKRFEPGNKNIMAIMATAGTTRLAVDPEKRQAPTLSSAEVTKLVQLSKEIEIHFGVPQDIEWALANQQLHILQTRPVSVSAGDSRSTGITGHSIPGDDIWPALDERAPHTFDLWTQANVGEVWPQPVSPLMWSAVPLIVSHGNRELLKGFRTAYLDDIQWARRFYGRVYYNEGAVSHIFSEEFGLPGSLVDAALGSRRNPHQISNRKFRPVKFLRRLPYIVKRVVSQFSKGRELEDFFSQVDIWLGDFRERHLEELSDEELLAECKLWEERMKKAMTLHTVIFSTALIAFALLERMTARWLGRKELAQDLVTGLADVYTAEMGTALWQMAQKLQELKLTRIVTENEPAVAVHQLRETSTAQSFLDQLNDFLARHGHRCPNEGEWLYPRWSEAPEQVISVIAGYLHAGNLPSPEEVEARQSRRREETLALVERQINPFRRQFFHLVLDRARHAIRLRDNSKYYYMKVSGSIRQITALLGRRWEVRGWLEKSEDIFFLTFPDVERIIHSGNPEAANLNLGTLVSQRRKAFAHWFSVRAPEILDYQGRPIDSDLEEHHPGLMIQGIAASGGQARGTARIISDPQKASRLQPGDILITRAADPGWTLLFPLASGVVLEVGGQLSHAAIVAREYGIPAVVNVQNATSRIRDGQIISIDGLAGRVYLDPPAADSPA